MYYWYFKGSEPSGHVLKVYVTVIPVAVSYFLRRVRKLGEHLLNSLHSSISLYALSNSRASEWIFIKLYIEKFR
jgi:hypothetical protein